MAKRKPKIERDYVVLVNGKEVSTVVGDSGDALQRAAQYVPLLKRAAQALARRCAAVGYVQALKEFNYEPD